MSGLWKPFVAGPAKHFVRLLREPEYRTLSRLESALGGRPRYTPIRARLHGWTVEAPDGASFLASYHELFVLRPYAFPWDGPPPRILDLGANVGLSVLFFRRLHPRAAIVAVEADPGVFRYLERNLSANRIEGVEAMNRAAWIGGGRVAFHPEGADAGRIAPGDGRASGDIEVESLDVPRLLSERTFDFVKMDIEGAERSVLPACREGLARVRYIAVEYHSPAGGRQELGALLSVLEGCGFRVHVHTAMASPSPFLALRNHAGFDLQLNLFGWRP